MATPVSINRYGLFAARPADLTASHEGVRYYATDTQQEYEWDGAAWFEIITGGGSATPSGTAGGVLSGTYPNPGFAADMATQAELDAVAATIPGSEQIDDRVAALLQGASGVSLSYDDPANTLTISGRKRTALIGDLSLTPVLDETYGAARMPYDGDGTSSITWEFKRLSFEVEAAPSGGSAQLDVLKNGVSILASPITITDGNTTTDPVTAFATATCVSGDLIVWKATAVNSSDGWEMSLQALEQ